MNRRGLLWLIPLPLAGLGWVVPHQEVVLAEFTTSLAGRSRGQRHNAEWAVHRLNQAVIPTSGVFSFNRHVGPWTRDVGVVRAPVSYGGVLIPAWGGGVCQVSTTLYCAALAGGLIVLERHPHTIAPAYIPAGMDAAVAQDLADLRLKNPYAATVTIQAQITQDRLHCRLISQGVSPVSYELKRELITRHSAPQVSSQGHTQSGRPGLRVRLWRIQGDRWEFCHETEYAPLPQMG